MHMRQINTPEGPRRWSAAVFELADGTPAFPGQCLARGQMLPCAGIASGRAAAGINAENLEYYMSLSMRVSTSSMP